MFQAGLGQQRAIGDSTKGLDHLLPPGLTPEQHMRQARQLLSPFGVDATADEDMLFFSYVIARLGPWITHWRNLQRARLHRVVRCFDSILAYARKHAVHTVRAVAGDCNPIATAVMTALLKWPDRGQPVEYVRGFRIMGDFQPSGGLPGGCAKTQGGT